MKASTNCQIVNCMYAHRLVEKDITCPTGCSGREFWACSISRELNCNLLLRDKQELPGSFDRQGCLARGPFQGAE